MTKTRFLPPPQIHDQIAPTDSRDGQMLRGVVHDPTTARMGGVAGHAGVFSTVEDTAIYAQMVLDSGRYNGVRILSPLSVLQMTTPQSPVGATNWRGLGFDIRTPFSGPRGDLFPVVPLVTLGLREPRYGLTLSARSLSSFSLIGCIRMEGEV